MFYHTEKMDSYDDQQVGQDDQQHQQYDAQEHQEQQQYEESNNNNYESGFISPPTGEDIRSADNEDYPTLPASQPHQVQASADSDEPAVSSVGFYCCC